MNSAQPVNWRVKVIYYSVPVGRRVHVQVLNDPHDISPLRRIIPAPAARLSISRSFSIPRGRLWALGEVKGVRPNSAAYFLESVIFLAVHYAAIVRVNLLKRRRVGTLLHAILSELNFPRSYLRTLLALHGTVALRLLQDNW